MPWEEQLSEIVAKAQAIPTFEEWLSTTGYRDIPPALGNATEMRSVIQTLFNRYKRTYGM